MHFVSPVSSAACPSAHQCSCTVHHTGGQSHGSYHFPTQPTYTGGGSSGQNIPPISSLSTLLPCVGAQEGPWSGPLLIFWKHTEDVKHLMSAKDFYSGSHRSVPLWRWWCILGWGCASMSKHGLRQRRNDHKRPFCFKIDASLKQHFLTDMDVYVSPLHFPCSCGWEPLRNPHHYLLALVLAKADIIIHILFLHGL